MPDLALVGLGGAGLIAGLGLLLRGFLAQRAAARISNIGSSPVGLLAAGEVRITGEAVAAGITLPSPVRGRQALYYRALATAREGENERTLFDEQRGVGFFVRDASGEVRVFPRGARWEVPLDEPTPWAEGRAGLGGGLLLPSAPAEDPLHPDRDDLDFGMPTLIAASGAGRRQVTYREGRVEPGDIITIVGRAVPFRDLADPTEVDRAGDMLVTLTGAVDANHVPDPGALEDPEVAASYARALEAGTLAASPAAAWGNAAIEGFGVGRPVRPPDLHPGIGPARDASAAPFGAGLPPAASAPFAAAAAPLAAAGAAFEPVLAPLAALTAALPGSTTTPAAAQLEAEADAVASAAVERSFELPPDRLVIAAGPDIPLLIATGTPGEAAARHEDRFLVGLLGAVLAIASAVFLAFVVSGTLRI